LIEKIFDRKFHHATKNLISKKNKWYNHEWIKLPVSIYQLRVKNIFEDRNQKELTMKKFEAQPC